MRPMEGGMGLIFIRISEMSVRPSRLVWPYNLQTVLLGGITHLQLPTHPLYVNVIHDITVVVKKFAQNPSVLASYYR